MPSPRHRRLLPHARAAHDGNAGVFAQAGYHFLGGNSTTVGPSVSTTLYSAGDHSLPGGGGGGADRQW